MSERVQATAVAGQQELAKAHDLFHTNENRLDRTFALGIFSPAITSDIFF